MGTQQGLTHRSSVPMEKHRKGRKYTKCQSNGGAVVFLGAGRANKEQSGGFVCVSFIISPAQNSRTKWIFRCPLEIQGAEARNS